MKKSAMKVTVGLLAIAVLVVAIYLAFGPTPAWACGPCECSQGSGCYTQGFCLNNYVCSCTGDCSSCTWIRYCPLKPAAQPHALLSSPQKSLLVSNENPSTQFGAVRLSIGRPK